jgi:hypothetical protein
MESARESRWRSGWKALRSGYRAGAQQQYAYQSNQREDDLGQRGFRTDNNRRVHIDLASLHMGIEMSDCPFHIRNRDTFHVAMRMLVGMNGLGIPASIFLFGLGNMRMDARCARGQKGQAEHGDQ